MVKKYQLLFFTFSQLGVGVLNYLFQLFLMHRLSSAEYGEFLSWYSLTNLFLILAATAQIYSNFYILKWEYRRLILFFGLLASSALLITIGHVENVKLMSLIFVSMSVFNSFFLGQLQAQFAFVALGLLSMLGVLFRFVLIYNGAIPAITGSILAANICLAAYSLIQKKPLKAAPPPTFQYSTFAASVLLSMAAVTFPQLDFLAMIGTLDKNLLGAFGQLSTIFKVFYFVAMIIFQILLPFQIQNRDLKLSKYFTFKGFAILLIFLMLSSISMGLFLPFIWTKLSNQSFTIEILTVVMGTLATFIYSIIFFILQTFLAKKILRMSLLALITMSLPALLNTYFFHLSLNKYYIFSLSINISVLLALITYAKRKKAETLF